ncbi:MAG: ABC transporter ATP-binding protein [Verrucomicrobiota bacterium]
MNAIECSHVTRNYGSQKALEDFSLSLPPGSIYGFLGRNASGKTTLIRMLIGLMWPDQGEIQVLGKNPRDFSVEDRQKIGYLSEKQILPPALKIGQLVDFCRPLYPKWDDSLIQRLSDRFSLDPKKKIKELSNGQQRQVGFMLALAPKPDLLILDEPASTLDVVARREFLDEILELIREENRTVLFSTHILSDVERIADRVGILKEGKLVINESLDSLKENVKQIRFTSRDGSAPKIELPNTYRTKRDRQELLITARVDHPDQIQSIATNAGCNYEILSLNLEDLFVEISSKNI